MYARVIPILLIDGERLVKTRRFGDDRYIGDPRNAVRIFSQRDVDEIMILNIGASRHAKSLDLGLIAEIVSEAFVPVAVGGNVTDVATAEALFHCGVEKVVVGKAAVQRPEICRTIGQIAGAQAVIACVDVEGTGLGARARWARNSAESLDDVLAKINSSGAGEVLIHSVDNDGTRAGYDIPLLRHVSSRIDIPLIAAGGAADIDDIKRAIFEGGASAAAAGSLFVHYGRYDGVLISFPDDTVLSSALKGRRL